MFDSVIQGLLQGVTEYLPVSSSGHLSLFQQLSNFQGPTLAFDVVLHLATLLATVLYFWRDILLFSTQFFGGFGKAQLRSSEGWRVGWSVVVATLVTGLVGLAIKDVAEAATGSLTMLGLLWLVTACLCFMANWLPENSCRIGLKIGLLVGLAQGFAVMPGISRSGATIVTALALGVSGAEAFRFSFLASLPAIVGAAILELKDVTSMALPSGWWLGFIVAFVVGLVCLVLLRQIVNRRRWWPFGVYCGALGLLCLFVI